LEDDIRSLLEAFIDETGLTPIEVRIERLVVQPLNAEPDTVIAGVRVLVNL